MKIGGKKSGNRGKFPPKISKMPGRVGQKMPHPRGFHPNRAQNGQKGVVGSEGSRPKRLAPLFSTPYYSPSAIRASGVDVIAGRDRDAGQWGFRVLGFNTVLQDYAWQATGWWLLLLIFWACRLLGSSSGPMTTRGLCWKADVTVTVTVTDGAELRLNIFHTHLVGKPPDTP
jgi:hypothetical protein